ncbi:MAG TPA: OsmC family protein [Clostridia bacterium]|nr:OsmC family protein [Clostridia bacterium]
MGTAYEVRLRTVDGGPTALGSAGPFTLVSDRPAKAGGGGLGFSGGQLLHLAIAACYVNDLYREAPGLGVTVEGVDVTVDGDFPRPGDASTGITVDLDIVSPSGETAVRTLVEVVDRMAEIPGSLRGTTTVELRTVRINGGSAG